MLMLACIATMLASTAAARADGFGAPEGWTSGSTFYGSVANLVGDVDGDGKADLIAWNAANNVVELSNGAGFGAPQGWTSGSTFYGSVANLVGDVDGDGKADLIAWNTANNAVELSTGHSFGAPQGWTTNSTFYGNVANVAGDVNGDGRADLIAWNRTGIVVELSNGHGFDAPQAWTTNSTFYGSVANLVGDVNGDGYADLIAWNAADIAVELSNGHGGFSAPQGWTTSSTFSGSVANVVGDVNGDGKADLVAWNAADNAVELSSGSAFGAPQGWTTSSTFHGTVANLAADVTGDCSADLIAWNAADNVVERSGVPSPYPTSCRFGGPNHIVDTTAEADAVVAAIDQSPDDQTAQSLIDHLRPADHAIVDQRLKARVSDGNVVRDTSDSRAYYYAGGTVDYITPGFADPAGLDISATKRVSHSVLTSWTMGPDLVSWASWKYGGGDHSINTDAERAAVSTAEDATDLAGATILWNGMSPADQATSGNLDPANRYADTDVGSMPWVFTDTPDSDTPVASAASGSTAIAAAPGNWCAGHINGVAWGQSNKHRYAIWAPDYGLKLYDVALSVNSYDCDNGHTRTYFALWYDTMGLPRGYPNPISQFRQVRFNGQTKPYEDANRHTIQSIAVHSQSPPYQWNYLPYEEMFPPGDGSPSGRMSEVSATFGTDSDAHSWPHVVHIPLHYATTLRQP
jgi:hypothetical protein